MRHSLFVSAVVAGMWLAGLGMVRADQRDHEEWVKYADTPRDVRNTIDRERRNHDIKRIDHVWKNNREFYRVIIDAAGGQDTVVRMSPEGRVLSREEVSDLAVGNEVGRDRADAERQVRYATLPERVKETIDRERGRHDIKAIYQVSRGDRVFYRVMIDERNGDRMIRVGESGRILSDQDIAEARPAAARFDPRFDDRGNRREFGEGQEIPFNRLPGDVKTTLGAEAGAEKVGRVVEYRSRDGFTVYRAEIIGPTRTRIVRVDGNGRLMGERDATEPGKQRVRFDDLPGDVKKTIGQEVPRGRMGDIMQITRDGRTYYRVEVDEGAWSRWLTISETGRVTGDVTRDNDRR